MQSFLDILKRYIISGVIAARKEHHECPKLSAVSTTTKAVSVKHRRQSTSVRQLPPKRNVSSSLLMIPRRTPPADAAYVRNSLYVLLDINTTDKPPVQDCIYGKETNRLMAILDTNTDKECIQYIRRRLKYREMMPDFSKDWEAHGPHPDIGSEVLVGPAKCKKLSESFVYVAIYPGAVYAIDDRDKWLDPKKEDKIIVGK
jgi:hypothetical protein